MKNLPIGEYLVAKGHITQEQCDNVLALQTQVNFYQQSKAEEHRMRFGTLLVHNFHYMKEHDFMQALAEKHDMEYVNISNAPVDENAVRKIPEAYAKDKQVLAIGIPSKGKLAVVINQPNCLDNMPDIKVITGLEPVPMLSTHESISQAIETYYGIAV
jgi:hypothetical protein